MSIRLFRNAFRDLFRFRLGPPAMNPSLQIAGMPQTMLEDLDDDDDDDETSDSFWFAAPKRKVSRSRRRMRTNNPDHKMKPDESIYQCPQCHAYKKRHVLLHCPEEPENCGLGEDKCMVFGKERPVGVVSAPSQGQTWHYKNWSILQGEENDEQDAIESKTE